MFGEVNWRMRECRCVYACTALHGLHEEARHFHEELESEKKEREEGETNTPRKREEP